MIVREASGSRLELVLDAALYTDAVVFKCFYWYGRDFDVVITHTTDMGGLLVSLTPRGSPLSPEATEAVVARVKRDLVDFKTRDIIARETQAIRELLVAKAFAHSDEYDQPALGTIAIHNNGSAQGKQDAIG
jgi:His-Xaa-Ser system protein HxsD